MLSQAKEFGINMLSAAMALLIASFLFGCASNQSSAIIHVDTNDTSTCEEIIGKLKDFLDTEEFENMDPDEVRWFDIWPSESSRKYQLATHTSRNVRKKLIVWMHDYTDMELYSVWGAYYRETDIPLVAIQFTERRHCEECGFSDRATVVYERFLETLEILFPGRVIVIEEPH